jgi:FKBP-type peptidyl-prolyl cis-trans isomerase
MTKRLLATLLIAVPAGALSACGSSSKAPGIQPAPSGGQTQAVVTTSTTATTPAALASKPAVQLPSGAPPKRLVTKDLVVGTGPTAQSGQTVTVNYVGVLYKGGKEFDSSWKRNTPFSTALSTGSVIPGWVQGIAGMKVGGRRELIIPPSLAYKNASQPGIPPNSTLVFVVDLLSVA